MKSVKFLVFGLLTCLLLFSSNVDSHAQNKANAKELLSDLNKSNNKKAFDIAEKGLVAAAQSRMKGFTVTEVKIDRKTGMISVIGKNGKGQVETLQNVENSPYYDGSYRANTASSKKNVFDRLWDWIWGTSAPEPEDEYPGDTPPNWPPKKPSPEDWMNGNADH